MLSITEVSSFVGGEWLGPGAAVVADLNPARPSEVVADVHVANAEVVRDAASTARDSFGPWRDLPAPARGDVLRRAAEILSERAESIGRDLAREEGKTLAEAIGEVRRASGIMRYYAAQTLEPDGETYPSTSGKTFLFSRREPIGVVLVVTPWNFPIAIPAWKIAPALAYGNTVVWKPAELVPVTATHLVRALAEAGLPDGVLNLVVGRSSDIGDALLSADVDAVSFTGSNGVGRRFQANAVERGWKAQLELGGKNPAIVLADADLALAAEQVARGAFLSAGQKCTATSRVIVQRSVLPEFAERLGQLAATWRLGDPLNPATVVGPVASRAQLESIVGFLEGARDEGANVLTGGGPATIDDGWYVRPTVLTDVDPASPVVREEVFGPVAALLEADSYEDAVRQANDTPYGLSAALFTRDLRRALDFVKDIRAGVVKVNQESAGLELHVPFGGTKQSSSGSREQGKAAREFFTEWKTVYIDA